MSRRQIENSPLQELADKADAALRLCWDRLEADDVDEETIREMVAAWRMKRKVFLEKEEEKS